MYTETGFWLAHYIERIRSAVLYMHLTCTAVLYICVHEGVYYSNKNNGYGNDLPAYVLSRKFPDEKQLDSSTNSGLAYRQGKLYIIQQIYVCASS